MDDKLSEKIPEMPQETLCAYIIAYRTLGFNKQVAILAMSELARRRNFGEVFDFENYISEGCNKIKPLEISTKSSFQSLNLIKELIFTAVKK